MCWRGIILKIKNLNYGGNVGCPWGTQQSFVQGGQPEV